MMKLGGTAEVYFTPVLSGFGRIGVSLFTENVRCVKVLTNV